ncbi:MAG TPA: hypothetical protein VFK09_06470 [Gemmatimonadales bacterium]|jgi:hypothetical protein|nr:hypothetical protein [Gemmatimonadales bacterium]
MSNPQAREPVRRHPLGRRNLVLLAAAVALVIAGYGVLEAGSPSVAAVLLVVGYCVVFPLGIAL